MDTKLTLSFDALVIEKAKEFAAQQGISLSRLIEILLRKATDKDYEDIEALPIASWVNMVAEGPIEYKIQKRGRKSLKDEYFNSQK